MSCYPRTNILCWELCWKKQSCSAITLIQVHDGKTTPVKSHTAVPAAWSPTQAVRRRGSPPGLPRCCRRPETEPALGERDSRSAFPSRRDTVQASLLLSSEHVLLFRQLGKEKIAARGYVQVMAQCGCGPWVTASGRGRAVRWCGIRSWSQTTAAEKRRERSWMLRVSLGIGDELHFIAFIFL